MASRAGMLGSVVEAEEGGRWGKTTGVCRGNAAISTPSPPWRQVASRPWTESRTQVCPPHGLSWAAGLLVQEKWSVCTLVPCRGVEEAKARRLTHGRPLTSDRRVPPFPYRGETATHNKPTPPPCTVENGPAANTSGPAQSILFLRRRERSDWRLERRSFGVAHERRLKSASGEKMTNRRHTAVETRESPTSPLAPQ